MDNSISGTVLCTRLYISGMVQGVGYRRWFCDAAEKLGLTGWVRNRRDGRVEALIVGTARKLNDMQALAQKGPMFANVESVVSEPAEYTEVKAGFYIEETM